MQHNSTIPAMLLCAAFLSILAATATAQITVTSPTNGSTWTTVPVQLTANVSACAGSSNITLFDIPSTAARSLLQARTMVRARRSIPRSTA